MSNLAILPGQSVSSPGRGKPSSRMHLDVKRPAFKAELLKVTKLCTVPVRAYLPREHSGSFGVLRDIDPDYTENDIKTQLQSSIGIIEVKRLGKTSPVVRCYKFDHIAAACTTKSQLCHRCGKRHDGMCEGAPYCVNCEGDHASNAADCPVKERETEIIRCKLEHNTTFREAKGAFPLLKTPEGSSDKSVDVASTTNSSQNSSFWEQSNIKDITSHTVSEGHMPTTNQTSRMGQVILVRNSVYHHQLDLTKYCSERAHFAGVQVRTRRKDIVIVSAYIHPLGKWRPHVLAEMRAELGTDMDMLIGGDFNAHNESWGDGKTTARGRRLQKLLDTTDFEEIGTGTPTFLRTDTQQSVIDLTFTAGTLRPLRATPQPHGWGSDHTPIVVGNLPKPPSKTCKVVDWTKYRSHLSSLRASGQPLTTQSMAEALRLATHTVSVPTNRPNPDLEWLKLRAKRRQAQRRAKRTRLPEDQAMTIGQEDLHLHELKRALASLPRKKSAPGPDGVTNQALRNLEEDALPDLLAYLNEVWTTACLPADWKKATVVPLLKPGKPSDQPNSYRPIALTSCVGKLFERIILCRLVHHLETVGALPECYAGFRRGRCTADAIADLVTALEDGKARHRTTSVVLLDISKAFDTVEHNSKVTELKRLGAACSARCCSVWRWRRSRKQSGQASGRTVQYTWRFTQMILPSGKNVQKELQRALDNIYHFLTTLGLTLSAEKSVAQLNAPHRTFKFTLSLQIARTPVPIVKQVTYLGLKLDDRVSCQPAVSTVLNNKKTTSILCILGGVRRGTSQRMMLQLYHELIKARTLYALPLLDLNHRQWASLERAQRVALRVCLGVLRTASSRHTLVESGTNTVQNAATERALRHFIGMQETPSTVSLVKNIATRRGHLATLVNLLEEIAGCPTTHVTLPPPPSEPPTVKIEINIAQMGPKRVTPATVAYQHTSQHIDEFYHG
ncbi:hypothetical protein HPB47_009678 [Ixodes persulcatus]|uniref:Uncharacterized protein n=1 Tax=Ixodes persulcatus TaxID=34615 RepID=A0AC60P1G3_IXOPE|nr:hypothetical protein HPB47_009678 [Ixodes persulcatus]